MPKVKSKASAKSGSKAKLKTKTKTKVAARRKPAAKATVSHNKKLTPVSGKQTKTQIIREISENTGLTNQQVKVVLEELHDLAERHMKKRGSGEFIVPMLGVKIRRIRKKATKKRMGRNPFTGQEIMIPAKPARDVIKVTAMKAIKEMLEI